MNIVPPLIKANNYTSSATPYTPLAVVGIITAPGAGKRIRIVGWRVVKRLQNPLVSGECGVELIDSISALVIGTAYLVASAAGYTGGSSNVDAYNDPGWQFSDNAGLTVSSNCSVASYQFSTIISYYIDVVT